MKMCEDSIISSNLGTKEYWEHFYDEEYENFIDHGEIGEIWFGKANVHRILNWLQNNNIDKNSFILDVGCGNGATLLTLAHKGYHNLVGIDYVSNAVRLADKIANENNICIEFEVADFLLNKSEVLENSVLNRMYDVILDKGTYDAIGLCPNEGPMKRMQYINNLQNTLSFGGYFLIVSCNWTKDELLSHFTGFYLHDEISIPSMSYGGKQGQTVTSLILKKICNG